MPPLPPGPGHARRGNPPPDSEKQNPHFQEPISGNTKSATADGWNWPTSYNLIATGKMV